MASPLRRLLALALLAAAAGESRPRIAVCLTGQLSRLELASKVSRLFEPNLRAGLDMHVFLYLAQARPGEAPRQSRPRLQLGTDLYLSFSAEQLSSFLTEYTRSDGPGSFRVESALLREAQPYHYARYGDRDPLHPLDDDLTADQRFQLNFAMLAQMRRCMQMVQAAEVRERAHFDYVVRLRDDSILFDDWLLAPESYGEGLTDVEECSWGAVNDHTFVVGRRHADAMFRAPVEDYYLQNSVTKPVFGTSEVMLLHVSLAHGVPIRTVPVCEMPLVPLRGLLNATHWRLHQMYVSHYLTGYRKSNGTCDVAMLHAAAAPLAFPDTVAAAYVSQRFNKGG